MAPALGATQQIKKATSLPKGEFPSCSKPLAILSAATPFPRYG